MPEPLDNPQHAEIAFPHPAKGKNRRNEKEKTEGLNPALQPLNWVREPDALFLSVKVDETSLSAQWLALQILHWG